MEDKLIDNNINYNEANTKKIKILNYKKESVFSKVFFLWVFKIFNVSTLKKEDFNYYINSFIETNYNLNTNTLVNKFYYLWNELNYRNKKSNALIKTLFKCHLYYIALIFILSIINSFLDLALIHLFRVFVKMFTKLKEEDISKLIIIGVLFFFVKFFNLLLGRQCGFFQSYIGYTINSQLNAVVYNKVLLSSLNLIEKKSIDNNIKNIKNKNKEERKNNKNVQIYNSNNNISNNTDTNEKDSYDKEEKNDVLKSYSKHSSFIINKADNINNSLNDTSFKKITSKNKNKSKLNTEKIDKNNKYSEGEIINLIQIDGSKVSNFFKGGHRFIIIPFKILFYIIYLIYLFSYNFVFGFLFVIISAYLNYLLQKRNRQYNKNLLLARDKVSKIVSELFNSLKIIKLYGWDDEFSNKIIENRENVLYYIYCIFKNSIISITVNTVIPVLCVISTLGGYQLFSGDINIEDAFTCSLAFNTIKTNTKSMNFKINQINEIIISCNRIENFIRQSDIEYKSSSIDNLIYNKCNSDSINKINNDNNKLYNVLKEESFYFENINLNEVSIYLKDIDFSWNKPSIGDINSKDSNSVNNYSNNELDSLDKSNSSIISTDKQYNLSLNNEYDASISINKLIIYKKEFVVIIGKVGSGKSSLLNAIINEMHILPHKHNINYDNTSKNNNNNNELFFVNGNLSYVSQMHWLENKTLKENILFNKELDQNKYNNIISICQLNKDLDILPGGDNTEIGEKGINLSGGQKARISLARSIYHDNDIYLLDDPLASLDNHVGNSILNNCILNYLKDKTRILVTNNLDIIDKADKIVYIDKGSIKFIGSYNELIKSQYYDNIISKAYINKLDLIKSSSTEIDINNKENYSEDCKLLDLKSSFSDNINNKFTSNYNINNNKIQCFNQNNININSTTSININNSNLTKEEIKEEGEVSWQTFKEYINLMNGYKFILLLLLLYMLTNCTSYIADIYLKYWKKEGSTINKWRGFFTYSAISLSSFIFIIIRLYITFRSSITMSRYIFKTMINKLIKAPINLYHDTVKKGMLVNRLTKDIVTVDRSLVNDYRSLLGSIVDLFLCFVINAIFYAYLLLYLPISLFFGYIIIKKYRSSARELTRYQSISRTPIAHSISEVVSGAIIIRAYNLSNLYKTKFLNHLDFNLSIKFMLNGVNCWFNLYQNIVSIIFLLIQIIIIIIFRDKFDKGTIAIMLNSGLMLQNALFDLLSTSTDIELDMVSMERCLDITNNIPQENYITNKDINENINIKGNIKFVNYSVRYRPNLDYVLKNLNLEIKQSEKIGIIGRTGCGKSTLCLSLFRILEPSDGTIYIDDTDICKINLLELRNKLTIIPQDPVLFDGTLRYNIDPLNIYSDEEIINCIKEVQLEKTFIFSNLKDTSNSYIIDKNKTNSLLSNLTYINILDYKIQDSGCNLSIGQKQLICIIRAVLRKSSIIIMDEATASIDFNTETLIQEVLEKLFYKTTVITIAHRIKTIINYDKILVLEKGEVIDFDTPVNLISKNKIVL